MLTLYDAPRCPYCARVRIVLAEKRLTYRTIEIDLDDRPIWLYEKNPLGKVPVLEEQSFALPESRVIMDYLEERYPRPPLLPADPAERARIRLWLEHFGGFAKAYYRVVFGGERADDLEAELLKLDKTLAKRTHLVGSHFSQADIAYVPWVIRAGARGIIDLRNQGNVSGWLARLSERPPIAAEMALVETSLPTP